ncbi:MAG: hypothetical protein NC098_07900 [Lachnoclostridium sp.]|nr:hypothetical protein [Lachnoclostridium sp.]
MRRLFSIILTTALMIIPLVSSAKTSKVMTSDPSIPDFSLPVTVMSDSRKALHKALDDGDSPAVARALINFAVASDAKDSEKVTQVISLIDSVKTVTTDSSLKGILDLLEATIYAEIYNSSRYKYDNRELPLTPLDPDPFMWSGEQFRDRIFSLANSALTYSDAMKSVPLTAWSEVIKTDKLTALYYPTLYDFAAYRSIELISNCTTWRNIFSTGLLVPHNIYVAMRFNQSSPEARRILEIYSSLLTFHAADIPALINTDIRRIDFISRHIFTPDYQAAADKQNDLLKELYNSYSSSEYSGDVLIAMTERDYETTNTKWIYDAVNSNLSRFSSYPRNACLENILMDITARSAEVKVPEVVRPGVAVNIPVDISNAPLTTIKIYNISDCPPNNYNTKKYLKPENLIATLTVTCDEKVPFTVTRNVSFTFPRPGYYAAVPEVEGGKSYNYPGKIYVTQLALMQSAFQCGEELENIVYVVNPLDGKGVAGASLIPILKGFGSAIGTTDLNGAFDLLSSKIGNPNLAAEKGDDRYSKILNTYLVKEPEPNKVARAVITTSLPLYHPGDSIEWAAIIYNTCGNDRQLAADTTVKVFLHDPNGLMVDTVSCTTDKWGRISGRFAAPENRLTGTYLLRITNEFYHFTISDYKQPTFAVEMPSPLTGVPAAGDVTIRGNVKTYSGVAVAGATVKIQLGVSAPYPFYRFRREPDIMFYSADGVTNKDGNFEIVVTKDIIESSPCPDGFFTAKVDVTSTAGESHEASTYFTMKSRYNIEVSSSVENYENEKIRINARIVDADGEMVDAPICYTVIRDSADICSGILPADGVISTKRIPSGKAVVKLSCTTLEGIDAYELPITVYRMSDKKSPVPDAFIWSPIRNNINVGADRKMDWIFASNCRSRLLVIILGKDHLLLKKWIDVKEGMNRFTYRIPDGVDAANMSVTGYGNYNVCNQSYKITVTDNSLKIKAESFRDKITPGASETWSFSVVNGDGSKAEAAVITDMYNIALDAIATFDWGNFYQSSMPQVNSRLTYNGTVQASSSWHDESRSDCQSILLPDFNTYGNALYHDNQPIVMYKAMQRAAPSAGNVMYESIVEEAVTDMAADAGVTTESEEDDAVETAPEFAYRDSEVALAFFRPMLNTDAEGHLSLTFDVPNANTTWRFLVRAFTDELQMAEFDADVLASKPVMVQPNLPRFVRLGDDAEIKATVFNNTDSASTVTTVVEIFNPSTGEIIDRKETIDNVEANSSTVVSSRLAVIEEMPLIGYRIKSSTATYADGEQSLINVLESTTPVIESTPFYLAPEQQNYAMKLPDSGKDVRLTLQFCENPAWQVVTALPGLMAAKASTANEAAAAIFSAAVADGLLRDNPAIASALREWTSSDKSDSTLVSMLERNSDLKIALLNATPWMMDARSDTERMARLSLLFDDKMIASTYADNIATLSRLERGEGGWAWIGQLNEPSRWSTINVLLMMGRLKKLGYLPDSDKLNELIIKAVGYIDRVTAEDYRKYPKSDYQLYAFMRSMFTDVALSDDAKAVTQAAVEASLRGWKKQDIFGKAIDALILSRYGNPKEARKVLVSLREYADVSAVKGMWWPSLDDMTLWSMGKLGTTAMVLEAFAEVEPGCKDIDLIRQWIILQKEATDWGSSVTTTEVVNAVLSTSKRWLKPAEGVEVRVGGKSVVPSNVENVTGYFRVNLDAMGGDSLSISRHSDSPAFGAVFSKFTAGMADVKDHSIEDLSISRRLLKYDGTEVTEPRDLATGDRLRVELRIISGRDMDYVAVTDDRAACLEPVEQLPTPLYSEGICFYRENRDATTRLFISHLPKGSYLITYDVWVNNAGVFTCGTATIQSQYAPRLTAHSAGDILTVK